MKKINRVVGVMWCFVGSVAAMEDCRLQELPVNRMGQKQYGAIIEKPHDARHDTSQNFVVAVQQLPIELQGLIIKKMCDVVDDKNCTIPLGLGLKFYDELFVLHSGCPFEFGGTTYSAAQLFKWSLEKREKFLSVAKPPLYKQIGGSSNGTVTRDDYDEIIEMFSDEDGRELLQLKVLPSCWQVCCLLGGDQWQGVLIYPTMFNIAIFGLIGIASRPIALGVGSVFELGIVASSVYLWRKKLVENAIPVQLEYA